MSTRPRHAATLAVAAVVATGWAALPSAAQARVRTTCSRTTRVYSTPGGIVVGFLSRGAPVVVIARTRTGTWTDMRAVHLIRGWIRTKDLC